MNKQVLLVSPPVYDFRLEWAQWQQPIGLLQIAAYLRSKKKDVFVKRKSHHFLIEKSRTWANPSEP
jgi:hypothetical protein